MILNAREIARLLDDDQDKDRLILAPKPNLDVLRESGAASVDLRLGTWFVSTRVSSQTVLDVEAGDQGSDDRKMTQKHYIPLGGKFILHPRSFVLAATLEWIRIPKRFAGYVNGRSSWGRRGLVIETAPGVHPGFTGCLTLEVANVGEVPIAIMPGMKICQIFLHSIHGEASSSDRSAFIGYRQPTLGRIKIDDFVEKLKQGIY